MSPPAWPGVHDGQMCLLVGVGGGSPNVTMLCEMSPTRAGGQKSNVSERIWRANNSRPARPHALNWICLPWNERLRGCVSEFNQRNPLIRHFIKFPVPCGARCQTHFIGAVCGTIQSHFLLPLPLLLGYSEQRVAAFFQSCANSNFKPFLLRKKRISGRHRAAKRVTI